MNCQGGCCQQGGGEQGSSQDQSQPFLGASCPLWVWTAAVNHVTKQWQHSWIPASTCGTNMKGRAAGEGVHRLMTDVQGMGREPMAPAHSEVSVS